MSYKSKEEELRNKREYYAKNRERLKEYQRQRRQQPEHKERQQKYTREWKDRTFKKILEHYGKVCACCGESNQKFLTVDHINGGGTRQRKTHRTDTGTQASWYLRGWIVKNDFPDGFQILCINCNWGRAQNNGVCPHKEKQNALLCN